MTHHNNCCVSDETALRCVHPPTFSGVTVLTSTVSTANRRQSSPQLPAPGRAGGGPEGCGRRDGELGSGGRRGHDSDAVERRDPRPAPGESDGGKRTCCCLSDKQLLHRRPQTVCFHVDLQRPSTLNLQTAFRSRITSPYNKITVMPRSWFLSKILFWSVLFSW